jgi:hypothetical protein
VLLTSCIWRTESFNAWNNHGARKQLSHWL